MHREGGYSSRIIFHKGHHWWMIGCRPDRDISPTCHISSLTSSALSCPLIVNSCKANPVFGISAVRGNNGRHYCCSLLARFNFKNAKESRHLRCHTARGTSCINLQTYKTCTSKGSRVQLSDVHLHHLHTPCRGTRQSRSPRAAR